MNVTKWALLAVFGCWSATANAAYLYSFSSRDASIAFLSDSAIPETVGEKPITPLYCAGATNCNASVGLFTPDQFSLTDAGNFVTTYYYFPAGAVSTQGLYEARADLNPATLAVIDLSNYAAGDYVYHFTGRNYGSFLYVGPQIDDSAPFSVTPQYCAGDVTCTMSGNQFASDQVTQADAAQFVTSYYYFPTGTFSTPGTYEAQAALNPGSLTVFQIPSAAVPEPASWALMIAGLGLVGGTMRRRRGMAGALARPA